MRAFGCAGVLLALGIAASACKAPPPEPAPVEATPEDRQAVLDGFEALLKSVESCDLPAFKALHTQKAQGAFEALAKHLDPTALDPGAAASDPADNAVMWVCTLARMAGFVPGEVKPVAVAVNATNGTARVFFTAHGSEFGFPMARQFGKWRSPFPGHVFLVNEYRSWQDAVASRIPEGPGRDGLPAELDRVVKLLSPFQPNWTEFPEMETGEAGAIP